MKIDLLCVFEQLKGRYPLTLTSTFAVDDGFAEDVPVIVGRNADAVFWLYDDYGEFVFSCEVRGLPYHRHWHPQSVEEAVQAVADFMEGKQD